MELNQIKENAVIIADNYLHTSIRMMLLEKKEPILNVSILSFEHFLNQKIERKDDVTFYQVANKLNQMNLDVFKEVMASCDFIEEIIQFLVHFKKYNLDIETLPETDVYQRELKDIVKELLDISLEIDAQKEAFKQIESFKYVYIVDYNADIYKESMYKEMIAKGATRITKKKCTPTKEFFYVLNKREEVEALARYIIEQDISLEDSKLTLLDEEYTGFVKQIFERYDIPFYFIQKTEANRLVFKYVAMIHYYVNPCNESLMKLIDEEIFTHKYMESFKEYIHAFHKNLKDDFKQLRTLDITSDIVDVRELEKLCALEKRAESVKEYIVQDLQHISQLELKEALLYVDEVVVKHHYFNQVDDIKILRSIRNTIKVSMDYISEETLGVLVHQLTNIRVAQKETIQGIAVTSLKDMLGNKQHHFILGASSDHYPKFSNLSGIFSENYVAQFPYPSLDERYQLYENNLQQNLSSSNHLVVFYSTSTLSGKEKEAALEIESFMQVKPSYYKLVHKSKQYEMSTQLSKETSENLFFNEKRLRGSVSSLEMYSNCPFKYFVRYGLRVSEPADYTFNAAKSGTLMHYVLEVLAKQYAKQYPQTAQEEIESLLNEKIKELVAVYPHLKDSMQVVKAKVLESIEKNFQFMKSYEKHSHLIPTAYEHPFHYSMEYEDYALDLKGFIDRINTNNDFLSIMDYKSSKHVLKEEEVFSCLKLQLLTYIVVCAKTFQKRVVGAHYYSFQNKKQLAKYAKYTKKDNEITPLEEADYELAYKKEKRLEGWVFNRDVEVLDDDLTHINGMGYKADGSYTARVNIYDVDKIEVVLYQMYQQLLDGIVSGDMSLTPTSCMYCKYNSICHYKGKPFEREVKVVCDDIYQIHKGKEVSADGDLE